MRKYQSLFDLLGWTTARTRTRPGVGVGRRSVPTAPMHVRALTPAEVVAKLREMSDE